MLFLVLYGISFKIPMLPCSSVSGIDQLMLRCCSNVATVVRPKIVVIEGHVGYPSISGSCMRFDVGPAFMVSCQFSMLIKKHLVVCHKSGMFEDGAICLCDSARGSLFSKRSSQSVSSPFLGVESFLIQGSLPISLWAYPRYQYLGPPPLPWQCMHCTQGFKNCCHACLHHFSSSLYLGFSLLLGRYNPMAQEV